MQIGNSISPMTLLRVPSKALTIMALGFMKVSSMGSLTRVDFGMTFREEPLSIRTLAIKQSRHFTEICKALI